MEEKIDFLDKTPTSDTIQDFLYKLDICILGRFFYILDSSNSSSFTFWSSKLASSSRSNWTSIWTDNLNGTWTWTNISFQYSKRDECNSYILFHVKTTTNRFWNGAEMLLKSFWTSHLQMMNGLQPLF